MQKYIDQAKNLNLQEDFEKIYDYATKEHKLYCKKILTLDIETTSAWQTARGKIIPYTPGLPEKYWNMQVPLALPYIWQFSIDDTVYYGREWADFLKVLNDLPKCGQYIIWVHNLSFEFQFLTNLLTFNADGVFARNSHKVIYASPVEYPNIEFRCSYFLTRLSLDNWGEQLGIKKLVGDLDYEKIRTPLTALTDTELGYCKRDCEIVYTGIKAMLKEYKHQSKIPYTQTGKIRRKIKKLLMSDYSYAKFIKRLVPANAEQYKLLKTIFAGGYTHANILYQGIVQKGLIEHYDFASHYPTMICSKKYPMSPWCYMGDYFTGEEDFNTYAYIIVAKFDNIIVQTYNTYIQASKCHGKGIIYDNGRIRQADELYIAMTEQDYLIIKDTYKWDKMTVIEAYRSKKEYLPKALIDYTLDLYEKKTKLKGIKEHEEEYKKAKEELNSLFGMSCTAIVQADVIYNNAPDDGKYWQIDALTPEYVEDYLQDLKQNRPQEKRYFMSYSWGVWITAYARKALWDCILMDDFNVIYCDTDSIFVNGTHDYSFYNKRIVEELNAMCEELGIDPERTRPKTKKGKKKQLGVFEKEDNCIEFLTLGAKRYVERRESDNALHLTVSGINKEAVQCLNDNIENFQNFFTFDKDAEGVKKQLATYCDDMPIIKYPDGYISHYTRGINLRRTGYQITILDEYDFLADITQFITDLYTIPEQYEISMRGDF